MAELLGQGAPVQIQDNYAAALTLGPASGVKRINLSVISIAAVVVQCWRYANADGGDFQLEPFERTIAGQSIGVVFRNCAGIKIRNATAGTPATVLAELLYERDVEVEPGTVTAATISGSGAIT